MKPEFSRELFERTSPSLSNRSLLLIWDVRFFGISYGILFALPLPRFLLTAPAQRLESDRSRFESENWREVVPDMESASSEDAIDNLWQELGVQGS